MKVEPHDAGYMEEYEDVLPVGTKYVAINYTKPGAGYDPLTIDDFYFKPRAGLYGVYLNAVNNTIKTSARWGLYFGLSKTSLLSADTYVWEYVPGEDAEELANKMMGTMMWRQILPTIARNSRVARTSIRLGSFPSSILSRQKKQRNSTSTKSTWLPTPPAPRWMHRTRCGCS